MADVALTFGTVCSGIGAPEQALVPLNWRCVWQAEIEPHPCAVLAHHYGASCPETTPDPDEFGIRPADRQARIARRKALAKIQWPAIPTVRNLGDMTTIARRILAGEVEAPDVLIGGTPCQDFSIAGLRQGVLGDRGNLSLAFCKIANAIDFVRRAAGQQ